MTTEAGPRLLTVLHAPERTGPPLFALQFLRWLRTHHPDWSTVTLFLDDEGPLVDDFEALGPVVLARGDAPYGTGGRRLGRARTAWRHRRLRRRLSAHGPVAVAHVHCAGSFRALPALPPAPVLGHLHELSVGQDLHLGPMARRHLGDADRYVAVSDGVRSEFLERVGVDPALVERQWGFVDPARLPQPGRRAALGIDPDEVVVASSGVRHWRKAPELFVRTALAARRQAPDIRWRFVWVGGDDHGALARLVADSAAADLVELLPHQPDPLAWLEAADLFVLTAREDAFPLVCVEAAAIGRPIATFDNGGAAELVHAAGCGRVVPFPDVAGLAETLVALARDDGERDRLGREASSFAAANILLDHAGPALQATLDATRRGR